MKEFLKYIEDGINIKRNGNGTYTVFTISTQHFDINSIEELTIERFEKAVDDLDKSRKMFDQWDAEKRKDNPHHYSNRED